MAGSGLVEDMPEPQRVERFFREPPDDTRAFLRAHVLRKFGDKVTDMDWDNLRFRLQTDRYWWSETVLEMPDPTRFGKTEVGDVLERSQTLAELIEAIGTEPTTAPRYRGGRGWQPTIWGQHDGN